MMLTAVEVDETSGIWSKAQKPNLSVMYIFNFQFFFSDFKKRIYRLQQLKLRLKTIWIFMKAMKTQNK